MFRKIDGDDVQLSWMRKRVGVNNKEQTSKAMRLYFTMFTELRHTGGESISKYIAKEQNAYKKLQSLMNRPLEAGEDVWSDDEDEVNSASTTRNRASQKFKLPKQIERMVPLFSILVQPARNYKAFANPYLADSRS
eukprot:6485693-Amphidinium_carterae.4